MNRIMKLIILGLIVILLFSYFGIESLDNKLISNSKDFIDTYLNNFQKYLYIFSLIVSLFIITINSPFFRPDIAIRIKDIESFLLKKYLPIILSITFGTLLVFFFICICLGYYSDSIYVFSLEIFLRLFSTIFCYFVIYLVGYCITKSIAKSISILLGLNFAILILALCFQYYINSNVNFMIILNLYNTLCTILGLSYLYIKLENREIL